MDESESKETIYLRLHMFWVNASLAKNRNDLGTTSLNFIRAEINLEKIALVYYSQNSDPVLFASRGVNESDLPKTHHEFPLKANGRTIGALLLHDEIEITTKFSKIISMIAQAIAANLQRIQDAQNHLLKRISEELEFETTKLSKVNEELQKAIHAREQFLSQMSHEIRTPLNAIIGISEILLDSTIPKKHYEEIKTISKAGSNLLSIVNDILDLSKIQANQFKLDLHNFNLQEIIEQAVTLHRLKGKKNILIHYNIAPEVNPHRIGDSHRILQILNNLIGNALKFTEEGYIKVTVTSSGTRVLFISVEDTGIGISDDQKKCIFNEFNQSKNQNTQKYGGTGLGLTICEKIISLMSGKIWAENNKKRKGTIFMFQINLPENTNPQPQHQSKAENQISEHLLKQKRKILIADDSPDNILLAKAIFKKTSFEVTYVTNGKEAVEAFMDSPYDVVFMDLQMPELNGIDAAKSIRKIESEQGRKHSHLVALTADAYGSPLELLITLGFDQKLTKPVHKNEIFIESCQKAEDQ